MQRHPQDRIAVCAESQHKHWQAVLTAGPPRNDQFLEIMTEQASHTTSHVSSFFYSFNPTVLHSKRTVKIAADR